MLKLKMQTKWDILVIPNWRCKVRGRLRAWAIEQEGDRATKRDRDRGETENESESETKREIESMWESLIARLRKSEWVDSKIERGRGRLRKWVMRESAVGMWVSWVSEGWESKEWCSDNLRIQYRIDGIWIIFAKVFFCKIFQELMVFGHFGWGCNEANRSWII